MFGLNRPKEVSPEKSDALYRALRHLGYTTHSQTADVITLVEAWVRDEDLTKVVESIEAENHRDDD